MRRLAVALTILALAMGLAAFQPGAPRYGPAKGTLILVGGGQIEDTGILDRFLSAAGGRENGRFVVIPTNGGNRNRDGSLKVYQDIEILGRWKMTRGVRRIAMLHTADPKEADTEAFVRPLLDATGVWLEGGRQWNMVDSYKGTRTEREIAKVLERGGVVAGTSAGATIQGEYLIRGDSSGPDVVMTKEPNHQLGFALLKRTAIDQHIDTRNRWRDLIQVMQAHPGKYLGIGISENTAIVVSGDRFEVIGAGKVAVHDYIRPKGEIPWKTLSPGDVYDMRTRRVMR